MVTLEDPIKLADAVKSVNVAELLSERDRAEVARCVLADFQDDVESRRDWETRMAGALELALQVTEQKTFPWPGASNVKFPLITIAALQFHSRAYPAMVPTTDLVMCRVFGDDPDGVKAARAERVSSHMSYQVLEQDEAWEDNHDRVLITVPIVGCAFKKSYYDPDLRHNVSEYIAARDIYLPYYAQSVEKASRITQRLYMARNQMVTKMRRGVFLEIDLEQKPVGGMPTDELGRVRDEVQGITPPMSGGEAPFQILEQHRWLDLDGDGYEEPYVVSVREDTGQLLRIVARFTTPAVEKNSKGEVVFITPSQYFTKYPFIPSPDGGIYDLGFGALLGPINESINSLINQLVDAGTLNNTAGGFLGRGAKFRSGEASFKPFEWKRVDSTGDDLRKSIVPLATKDPSAVLFQLLQLMINYGERIAGATDPMVGENPGQNTPAETSRNTIAEGSRVFVGIFKRLHRAMKEEFRKLYKLNQLYLDDVVEYYSLASGQNMQVLAADYAASEKTICPAADPNMVTDSQKMMQVTLLKQASASVPGYDTDAVERKFLEALKVSNAAQVFPGKAAMPPPPPDVRVQVEQLKMQTRLQEMQMAQRMSALQLLGEAEMQQAQIEELRAKAIKHLADAKGVDAGHQVALIQSQIAAAKQHQTGLLAAAKLIQDNLKQIGAGNDTSGAAALAGGVPGMVTPPGDASVPAIPPDALAGV